jgi:transcriptional regulator with XRE-family HTH domain
MEKSNEKISVDSNFGKRLRFLREKALLSQAELAKQLGYKKNTSISNLENGKSPPDINILLKLGKLFDANLHWLITGQSSPKDEVWRANYADLLQKYQADVVVWIQRLEAEIADLKQKEMQLTEAESRGETINPYSLEIIQEQLQSKQQLLDRIKDHLRQAFDRLGGIHIEF